MIVLWGMGFMFTVGVVKEKLSFKEEIVLFFMWPMALGFILGEYLRQ